MSKHENPQAFPGGPYNRLGMTLRDYFAAQALERSTGDIWVSNDVKDIAKRCYRFADAMLEARQKGGGA